MESFFLPTGAISMQDVLITLGAFFAAWTKLAQSEKDRQLKSRDDTISYLEGELKKLRDEKKATP